MASAFWLACVLVVVATCDAFQIPVERLVSRQSAALILGCHGKARLSSTHVVQSAAAATTVEVATEDAVPRPGPLSVKIGGKSLNIVGILFALAMTAWVIALYPVVLVAGFFCKIFDDKRRRAMDHVVSLWARCRDPLRRVTFAALRRLSMLTCGYRPRVLGVEELPPRGEAVLYVPNHCSYLDILTLSGFLPRPLKYISKIEILRIPLIGWAMSFAGHVALRRSDRRSQLESYKKAVETLKNGNSLTAFAEGTRSVDGRLQSFKRGPFKMALDAGVDVIPLAIRDLHRWHPMSAIMPLGRPRDVELKILPRVTTPGKTPEQILDECHTAVNDALPLHQRALSKPVE